MAQSKLSLLTEAALIGVADFVLGILGLLILAAPYAALLALAFTGLVFAPIPFLPLAVNWLLTVILAGWLHIKCFTPFVYPTILKVCDFLRRANTDAKARIDVKRIESSTRRRGDH